MFHCRVLYEDSVYAPLRGRQELEENVGIYLADNYEKITVPVPHFGGSDPADIIHDFHRVRTNTHTHTRPRECRVRATLQSLLRVTFTEIDFTQTSVCSHASCCLQQHLLCMHANISVCQLWGSRHGWSYSHMAERSCRQMTGSVTFTQTTSAGVYGWPLMNGCVFQGLTAYHDIALDKCYVIELNTTIVMPPRNLWELLINVKVTQLKPQPL